MDVDLSLTIKSGNSAFGDSDEEARAEIGRILSDLADKIEMGRDPGRVFDFNGNSVGTCFLEIEGEPEDQEEEG